jgi:AcrR family transcriptional regulator
MEYAGPTRAGRPRASTHSSLAAVALRLFRANGFSQTSVEEIARAAGIGRSTFFNYFPSKADVMWTCQAHQFERLRTRLDSAAADDDPFEVAAMALIEVAADVGPEEARSTSDYRAVLENSPELRLEAQAWSAKRASMLAAYLAARLGQDERDIMPLSYAYALSGAVSAAAVAFGRSRDRRLSEIMTESVMPVYAGFAAASRPGAP